MEDGRVEQGAFDTQPELQQAADVVRLMRSFLGGKPVQFRDRIPFLKHGNIDIEWVASEDGVAFATFYLDGQASTMAVLVTDPSSEAGQGVHRCSKHRECPRRRGRACFHWRRG